MQTRARLIRFGIFEVNLDSGELRRRGVKVKLQEQPLQALLVLLERPGEVTKRDELQKRLWPTDIFGDFDRGLNRAMNRLREALGDNADNPQFIETLPQRGYRFIAYVETAEATPVTRPPELSIGTQADPPLSPPAPENQPSPTGIRHVMQRRGVLAVIGGSIALPLLSLGYRLVRSTSRRIESIAVLPLENLSGDPAQEYFSDGMTDELIGQIARIASLRVISRTSVMQYKGGRSKSLPLIARELNVDAILEGTAVQSGQKVRITAKLIRAHDDRHLWSEEYERDLTDIMAVRSEVARAVAREIQIKLTPREQTSLTRTHPVKPDAYLAFLKGNFFLHKGISGVLKSIDFFTQAVKLDPSYADAHAGLAQALCYVGIFGFRPSTETHPAARAAALKALELDASNASAHTVLAEVKKGYDWNLASALAEYQRALQLSPSHLLTRLWYAECLSRMGRYEEALAESGRTLALDPVSPLSIINRAMLFFRARRYDEAIRASQQALELDPQFINAFWWQGLSYAGNRDFSKAIASLTKAVSMNDGPLFRALLGHVYGRAGEKAKALGILKELTTMSTQRYVSPMDFAVIFAGLGDVDSTFQWLENAYETRATRVHELPWMYFDSVRSDPRYSDLIKRIGLSM
jgi:TolB-like protein/DNA-binding winged helix-turn-helix (wHTH) protein/cytochrome c-type biogenesis protein CcmH/NrfG